MTLAQNNELWEIPSDELYLESGKVHVWRVSLDCAPHQLSAFHTLLSADEQARAARFLLDRDRRRFIVSQGHLRCILSRYVQHPPDMLTFARGKQGKPSLQNPTNLPLTFNLSHSHELVVYAITTHREIGIDVEYVRPVSDAEQIASRFFSQHEFDDLIAFPEEQRLEAFFRCWTRKEAFIKAIGEGLYYPLDQFSVTLAPDDTARVVRIETHPQEATRWTLISLPLTSDYIGAIAIEGEIQSVSFFEYPH